MDSVHMVSPKDPETPPANKDLLLVQEKNIENVAVPPPETESQNSLQVTSTALSSTSKSSKGPKRSGSRKATAKTKKKKTSLPLYTDEVCGSSAVVTCADAVKCNAIESVCFSSSIGHMVAPLMIVPGTESVDMCHVKSSDSEQAAVVVPYGWWRYVNSGAVVYYRLHSLILLLLIVVWICRLLVTSKNCCDEVSVWLSVWERCKWFAYIPADVPRLGPRAVSKWVSARCLAVFCGGTLYIHFWAITLEFCQLQNSLCIQVLHSPILAVLLHRTWAVCDSQALRRWTRKRITELSLATYARIFCRAAIALGIGPHSGLFILCCSTFVLIGECVPLLC